MTDHEFGDCSLTVCDLCFMYVKGHSAGKEQAFLEIEELPARPAATWAAASCTSAQEAHQASDAESSGQDRRLMPRGGGASRKAVNFQFLYYIYMRARRFPALYTNDRRVA